MKKWRFMRFLSLILVLAMLIETLPVQSFASTDDASTAVVVEEGQPEVSVLGEVESLREEDTKHFRLSDGSFVAVSYGQPVHFQSEDGEWRDIDNSLSLAAGAYRTAKLQAALQERRRDDGFHWEVILEMPSERINAAVTSALAGGYAVTLQRLKILAHALPRTRGKP